jgi:hypothetical protein
VFFKLTTPEGKTIYVNFDLVTEVEPLQRGSRLRFCDGGRYVDVSERPDIGTLKVQG